MDYYIWAAPDIRVGHNASIMAGINFIVTILRMRAPGMSLHEDCRSFTWTSLVTKFVLIVAAFRR